MKMLCLLRFAVRRRLDSVLYGRPSCDNAVRLIGSRWERSVAVHRVRPAFHEPQNWNQGPGAAVSRIRHPTDRHVIPYLLLAVANCGIAILVASRLKVLL